MIKRYVEKAWQEVGKIKGTLLPQKDAIVQRESGLKNVTDFSFFYKGKFSGLKKGNKTVINGIDLYIINCLDYGSSFITSKTYKVLKQVTQEGLVNVGFITSKTYKVLKLIVANCI